uniref:PPPDE domain-containing protein n=1 Tax=Globodera rostochiensis TaxID=31243 RepID=A0A914GTA4_GLORO
MALDKLLDFDPRFYGNFLEESCCSCPSSQFRAIKFTKVQCDFLDRRVKRLGNAGRVAVGVGSAALSLVPYVGIPLAVGAVAAQAPTWGKDLTHTALEVLYRGSLCGHEVHVTYEIMGPGELSKEFGRYTKTYPPIELTGINTTAYEDIENVFSDMWTNYNFVYKNCKRWTNDLIKRLR